MRNRGEGSPDESHTIGNGGGGGVGGGNHHLAPFCFLQQAPETKAAFRIPLVAPACAVLDPTLASPSRSLCGCLIIDAYVLLILVLWCPQWTLQRGGWRYLSNSESRGSIPHPVHTQRRAFPADMTSALQLGTRHI